MINNIIEALVYAAALDVYRRSNRGSVRLSNRCSSAMLDIVDWNARPRLVRDEEGDA